MHATCERDQHNKLDMGGIIGHALTKHKLLNYKHKLDMLPMQQLLQLDKRNTSAGQTPTMVHSTTHKTHTRRRWLPPHNTAYGLKAAAPLMVLHEHHRGTQSAHLAHSISTVRAWQHNLHG
jgi:hypothetical protein